MRTPLCTLGIMVSAVACTDVELTLAGFPVVAEGLYCTESASTYDLPIRILLVIDTSRSMELNDPQGYRGHAAAELVTTYASADNVSFAFVGFNTGAVALTPGFTNDPAVLGAALAQLNTMEGFTNYLDALAMADTMVTNDLAEVAAAIAAAEAAGESVRFLRPWYFVVFLSDGIPRMPGGVLQDTDQILWRVEQLVDVPAEAAGLTLHTAFLGASNDEQRPAAELLLSKMAEVGGGSYTSFEAGEEIDFTVFSFAVKRLFDVKQLLVYNRTAVLTPLGWQADSDGDAIADVAELELGTDPLAEDSDGDGCRDGFELRAGLDPTVAAYCPCAEQGEPDSDADGLLDCEELFLGYDAERFDTDGDLFPDGLELRVGTNGADGDDWKEDLDFDGVASGAEIRQGTDPVRADADSHARHAYRFAVERVSTLGEAETCYQVQVTNLPTARTAGTAHHQEGINQLVFQMIESPEDAAETVFTLRQLVVDIAFTRMHPPTVAIDPERFVTISRQELPEP